MQNSLWGKLFEYRSYYELVFSGYERRRFFQNLNLFGTQRMQLWVIPIGNFIAAAITSTNRFNRVRKHELMQIILHRPNTDMKLRRKVRGRIKAPA